MENIVVNVLHMSTSKKVSDEFKGEVATKTAYLTVDEKTSKKLEEFGLQKYTSKEDKKDFFIVKLSQKVAVYEDVRPNDPDKIDGTVSESPNFECDNVTVNIIKGEHKKNTFYRIQAIKVKSIDDIKDIVQQNPFA